MKRVVGYLLAQQQPNGELIGHNVRIETYIIFTSVRRAKHSKYIRTFSHRNRRRTFENYSPATVPHCGDCGAALFFRVSTQSSGSSGRRGQILI